jgi:hypothetical protein
MKQVMAIELGIEGIDDPPELKRAFEARWATMTNTQRAAFQARLGQVARTMLSVRADSSGKGASDQPIDPIVSHEAALQALTDAIERLQIGILQELTLRYSERFPPSEALVLASCVLTHMLVLEPFSEEGVQYEAGHREVISYQAEQVSNLMGVSQAASYLYAGLTLLFAMKTADPFSLPASVLGNRATELGIPIANPIDMCGSLDAPRIIEALDSFSRNHFAHLRNG